MYWKVLLAYWQLLPTTGYTQEQRDSAGEVLRVPYTPGRNRPQVSAASPCCFLRLRLVAKRQGLPGASGSGSVGGVWEKNGGLLGVCCRVTGWWFCGLFSATEAH